MSTTKQLTVAKPASVPKVNPANTAKPAQAKTNATSKIPPSTVGTKKTVVTQTIKTTTKEVVAVKEPVENQMETHLKQLATKHLNKMKSQVKEKFMFTRNDMDWKEVLHPSVVDTWYLECKEAKDANGKVSLSFTARDPKQMKKTNGDSFVVPADGMADPKHKGSVITARTPPLLVMKAITTGIPPPAKNETEDSRKFGIIFFAGVSDKVATTTPEIVPDIEYDQMLHSQYIKYAINRIIRLMWFHRKFAPEIKKRIISQVEQAHANDNPKMGPKAKQEECIRNFTELCKIGAAPEFGKLDDGENTEDDNNGYGAPVEDEENMTDEEKRQAEERDKKRLEILQKKQAKYEEQKDDGYALLIMRDYCFSLPSNFGVNVANPVSNVKTIQPQPQSVVVQPTGANVPDVVVLPQTNEASGQAAVNGMVLRDRIDRVTATTGKKYNEIVHWLKNGNEYPWFSPHYGETVLEDWAQLQIPLGTQYLGHHDMVMTFYCFRVYQVQESVGIRLNFSSDKGIWVLCKTERTHMVHAPSDPIIDKMNTLEREARERQAQMEVEQEQPTDDLQENGKRKVENQEPEAELGSEIITEQVTDQDGNQIEEPVAGEISSAEVTEGSQPEEPPKTKKKATHQNKKKKQEE